MSYGNNDVGFTFLIIFVLLALVFVVGFLSCDLTSNSWRNKAVEVGAAEYYLDENNSRQWHWLSTLEETDAISEKSSAESK